MLNEDLMDLPYRPVRLGSSEVTVEQCADGSILIDQKEPLGPYPDKLTERLVHWAQTAPERPFLARRPQTGEGWEQLSYAEALRQVCSLGQALLDRGLSRERPIMILSDKSFEHALLALAALHVGVPYIPVAPAYSLVATDFVKLRYLQDLCKPGLVFAEDGVLFGKAVGAVFPGTEFVVSARPPEGQAVTPFSDLLGTQATIEVDEAYSRVGLDTLGKIMFTSGTTGAPKGVMFPQRMLCSNRQQMVQNLPFLQDDPPVLVDWLPWHHTFGGTNNFGIVLYGGGTYYMDPGKPMPEQVAPTVDALREVAPTMYLNTPQGFSALLPYMRSDAALRENFFSRLKLIYYGAARLPVHIWAALDELAVQTLGERILILSGLGSTEVGPTPASTTWDPCREAIVGLPLPGVRLKLVPVNDKLEIRYASPCVSPGYWKQPELTRAAFDEEGFFRSGDAVTFIDPDRPERGLRFDGRIAENFKLLSGTWVDVGQVREHALAAFAPYANEVVIAGHDREFVSALVFPDMAACRELCPELRADAADDEIVASVGVRRHFQKALNDLAANAPGTARRVARIVLETEPPTLDNGELTAKSALSQAAVLARRSDTIAEIYRRAPSSRVIMTEP